MHTKHFITSVALSLILTNLMPTFYTIYHDNFSQSIETINDDSFDITLYAEETKWCYRTVDGKLQKRLWSLTYRKWLTNWVWV